MISLFKICFESIKIYGYSLNVTPLASQCLSLLNISHILRKNGRVDDAIECEILLGLSMLSSRKYIQASEILKKCSEHFIQQYKQTNQSEFNSFLFQGKQHFLDNTPKKKKSNKEQVLRQKNEDIGQLSGNNTSMQGSKKGVIGSSGNSYHSYSEQQCVGTNNKYLLRAAKMELLIADSINHPSMIIEKLQAYQRATEYFTNQQYKEIDFQDSYDVYSGLLQLCPFLCKFLVKTLSDPFEPIKLAGIKGLEFLIEYLGCTLGNFLPQILSAIFKTYPQINDITTDQTQNHSFSESQVGSEQIPIISGLNNQKIIKQTQDSNRNRSHAFIEELIKYHLNIGIGQQQLQQDQKNQQQNEQLSNLQKGQYLINFKIIIDMYHHLLESFLNVLASASSQILRVIFSDVIVSNLFKQDINPELKVYCIRIAEKILAICQGDIEVSSFVINELILLLEEMNTKPNVHANLKFHVNKLWESLKLKFVYNMGSLQMNKLIEWIGDNLIQQSENENLQNFTFLYHLLDITSVICYKLNGPNSQKRNNLINSSRNQKENHQNSPSQEKNIATTPNSNASANGQQNNNLKTNSSQILTTQMHNSSQDYESSNVIMKFYFKLKNQRCALVVNQNELVNIQYLLKPLMIWIENSLQYQTKLELFRSIWYVLIEVFVAIKNISNPQSQSYNNIDGISRQKDYQEGNTSKMSFSQSTSFKNTSIRQFDKFTIADITLPLLQKINLHIQNQQPNEKMLQFLIIISNSLLQFTQESSSILFFFLEFFESYVQCIPHSIYDETFIIFDNLCDIISPKNFTPHLIEQCINMLLDQYTVKGKAHRKSKDKFIQVILQTKQNLHEALQKLLFENQEIYIISKKKKDTKLFLQMQELFSEKLSLVSEIFSQLNKENFQVIEELIQSNRLQKPFLDLINSRNSKSRLKGLNILKVLFEQYLEIYEYSVKPIQKLNRQDAFFIKLMLICLKRGLEHERDSKLQFNALLILDQFFQHLFKGLNLEQEISLSYNLNSNLIPNKQAIHSNNQQNTLDFIENLITKQNPYIEFDSEEYLQFRQKEILKLWPIIGILIDSPWSNIRSIAYGIICYWVKDGNGLKEKKFLSNLIKTLQNLLASKESECRTGGLNILGSLCGLGFNFEQNQNDLKNSKNFVEFFRRNSHLIPNSIWETVYDMQFDWDQTNQAASIILVQLCAPKDCVKNIIKSKQGGLSFKVNSRAQSMSNPMKNVNLPLNKYFMANKLFLNSKQNENDLNIQNMALYWENLRSERNQPSSSQKSKKELQIEDYLEDQYVFWMPQLENEDIMELISMFKNEFKPPQTLWIERVNYNMEESKQEDLEQNYSWIDEKQTFDTFKQFGLDKEEEILDFEDLGIIEIDDEEWNEYDVVDSDNTRRKIPNLKQKINNISPQLQIRDKSPSMRVLRKGKLQQQQQQQNQTKDTGIDSFSSRINQNNDKDIKQQSKSPEKINNTQNQKNQIIEEESGEENNSADELPDQGNSGYQEVEQYLQIDDGENVRIIDELELMQFLKQHNFVLQRSNNQQNQNNEDKQKKKQNQQQQSINKNQQSSQPNSSVSQSLAQSDKYDKFNALAPPIFIDESPQPYNDNDEDYGNSQQKYQYKQINGQQGYNNQINGNRQFDGQQLSDQKSNILSFSKNSLLSQQKSEDYIYSDSAESDDYQDVFIKQQEFLFRQQRQQKSQQNNNREFPNRPLSAKLKKEETTSNHGNYNNFQALGGQNMNLYHNFDQLQHQSTSLPSIAQLAAVSNSATQLLNKNQQHNKPQIPQSASVKTGKQTHQQQAVANLNQNYSGKQENIQSQKNYQTQDESSDDEHLNILKSRYSSSKQALTNNQDIIVQNDLKQGQQDKNKNTNQLKLDAQNKASNQKNSQQKQTRYFSPPRPQSNTNKRSDANYITDANYESIPNPATESQLLSSPFDLHTDIVNLDSPARPNQISPSSYLTQMNQSNFAQYQQLQNEYNTYRDGNKSSSDNKKKSKENSNSMMAAIGYYQNDNSNNNNNSTKPSALQNNYMSTGSDEVSNKMFQNSSNPANNILNSSPSVNDNNKSNFLNNNNLSNFIPVGSNSQLPTQLNQIQANTNFHLNNQLQENLTNGTVGVNSFEDNQELQKIQQLGDKLHYQQSQQNKPAIHVISAGQLSSDGQLNLDKTQNSISAAQGSFSYLQNDPAHTNHLQYQAHQYPINTIPQPSTIQQINNGFSYNNNNKFISDKININRLVSVPSNYKAHFGTNSSLSGIYPNSNQMLIQNQMNSSNSNQLFNSTLNNTINQNQTLQQHNNTLISHNSTGNLFKNIALNNSNYQQSSNTLPAKINNQIQQSRSKDKLLKKLMVNNVDFNDLKSVWKMNSEIKNISQHHNHSHSNNQHHQNQHTLNNTHSQSHQQLHQLNQLNHPIAYHPNLAEELQNQKDFDNIQYRINQSNLSQNTNQVSKTQRSNSLGRASSRGTLTPNLLTPLQLPISSQNKSKKDHKKKKNKKKNEKMNQNSSNKNNGVNCQGNNFNLLTQALPISGTTQSQQNTARNHHQQGEKKITNSGLGNGGSNLNSDRSVNNPESQLTFKKIQQHLANQGIQNNLSISSPQRKSLQQSPSQDAGISTLEKKGVKQQKNIIPQQSQQVQQQNKSYVIQQNIDTEDRKQSGVIQQQIQQHHSQSLNDYQH